MPGLSVDELIVHVRRDPRNSSVPIAVMSGAAAKTLPETDYSLRKPFALSELLEIAFAACGAAETRASNPG